MYFFVISFLFSSSSTYMRLGQQEAIKKIINEIKTKVLL